MATMALTGHASLRKALPLSGARTQQKLPLTPRRLRSRRWAKQLPWSLKPTVSYECVLEFFF